MASSWVASSYGPAPQSRHLGSTCHVLGPVQGFTLQNQYVQRNHYCLSLYRKVLPLAHRQGTEDCPPAKSTHGCLSDVPLYSLLLW